MSREVLGPATDAGTDLLEDDARGWGARRRDPLSAGDIPVAADAVTDLDTPPRRDPQRQNRSTAAWLDDTPARLRGALPLLVALLAGALLGGLVGTGTTERIVQAERLATVRVLASLTQPDGGFAAEGDGRGLRLWLVLVNAGPEPVTVTAARFAGSGTPLTIGEAVDLTPGRSHSVRATVVPQCPGGLAGSELELTVATADGQSRQVTPAAVGRELGVQPADLSIFCDPAFRLEPIPVWRSAVEDDGTLVLQLRNNRDEPAALDVMAPPGTVVVGDPPLPAELPTDRSVFVRLRVQVDRCTAAAQRADAGTQVRIRVDGQPHLVALDGDILVGWYAQSVARACAAA